MIVNSPHFLWLLALVPAFVWIRWRDDGPRRRLVAVLSGLSVAALVLALARPLLIGHKNESTTVLVVDVGPATPVRSVQDALDLLRDTAGDVRVVAVSNRAEVVADPMRLSHGGDVAALRERLARPLAADDSKNGGSALASALQLAGAQVAPGARGRVELFTAGLQSRGDAEAEAFRLAARGIAVRPHLEPAAVPGDVTAVVRHVSAPASCGAGQTVAVDVTVEALVAGDARVTLTGAGAPLSEVVPVRPGVRTVRLLLPLDTPGLVRIGATVSLGDRPASAAGFAAIDVGPAARVLLVTQDTGRSTAALGRLLGRSADIDTTLPENLTARRLADYNALVLADVPADSLSGDAQTKIRQAVLNGTGLLLTGAARSFGPGGYDDSALAPLLPVRMPQQAERIDPSTTLVLIIDTSGSMQDFQRMDLAKEVARLAISHLKPHDKVGIVEFYGGKRWAAPIQSAANSAVINRALSRLTAGGMTTLYPAVEEAAFALGSIESQSKHVLIISDGGVETAPFAALLRQMNDDGAATSAVAVAPVPGQPNMMPDLARWGGGRLYTVLDRFALPDITFKQPQMLPIASLVRTPSKLVGTRDPLLSRPEEVGSWPSLNGYVRTVARPTADVLLRTPDGDPLLARWRYGEGFVAALPTQLGSGMTQGLEDQPGFATLIAGVFRQLEARGENALDVRPVVRPAGVEVDVATSDRDASVDAAALRLTLTDDHGATIRSVVAEPVGVGRWNVLLPGITAGAYGVNAVVDGTPAQGRGGVAVVGPHDVPRLTADADLLRRISDFGESAARRAAGLTPRVETFIDLRDALAVLAVIALLLEVAARRWPERAERGLK